MNTLKGNSTPMTASVSSTENAFIKSLKNSKQSVDLIICRPEVEGCTLEKSVQLIRRLTPNTPFIVLSDDYNADYIISGLKMGAHDVVAKSNIPHLLFAISRELKSLSTSHLLNGIQNKLNESEARVSLLLDSSRDPIAYVIDGMHIYANQAYVEIFNYEDPDDLAGMPIMDMVNDQDQKKLKPFLRSGLFTNSKDEQKLTCECKKYDGNTFNANMVFSAANYDGEPCTQIIIRQEIDDSALQEKLKELSNQDQLTGLKNRPFFFEHLDASVKKASAESSAFTLIYLSIDSFPDIKSQVGIAGADVLLIEIGKLLAELIQPPHILARFGEDVFTILYFSKKIEDAKTIGESIRSSIEKLMPEVKKETIQLTSSIGINIVDKYTKDPQSALAIAHDASNIAREKTQKGNSIHLYDPSQDAISNDDMSMVKQLQNALDEGNFKLLYQPIVSLHGNEEEFYEILLRLKSHDKDILPAEFMPAAATVSLGHKIDRWVILQAIKTVTERRGQGHSTRFLVNLSGESIKDTSLPAWIQKALTVAKLRGSEVIFQISEKDAATYLKYTQQFTQQLADINCLVSITHFLGNENSFKTIENIQTNIIKLDGSITQDLSSNQTKDQLKQVIKKCQAINKHTIAPFVETAASLSILWQTGASYIQGYYIQGPSDSMNYDFTDDS